MKLNYYNKKKQLYRISWALKYGSYINFFVFWFGLVFFWYQIFYALTGSNQAVRYFACLTAAVWVYNIYNCSKYANLRHVRRVYKRWLVVERIENRFLQVVWELIVYLIIQTKGQGTWKMLEWDAKKQQWK